ncbi:hypothetical protein ACP3WT_28260, partial [Salmonella enterica]|uniref:hypothetical protein n=1 Tax=Salmonella enterica TaxID=28901 RepID=UPI003CF33A51
MSADRATSVAIDVRNNLEDYFLTPAGQVSFQDAAITRHDFRRSRSLSLFGRRLAVDVTGLLA